MNHNDMLKHQASLDSRRFAKGSTCKIISEARTIDLAVRYNLVPPGMIFNGGENGNNWINTVEFRFLVMPYVHLEAYEDLVKSSPRDISQTNVNELEAEEIESVLEYERPIIDFLTQTVAMATVSRDQVEGTMPNPEYVDFVIETVDVNQTLYGIFVDRPGQYRERRRTFRESQ